MTRRAWRALLLTVLPAVGCSQAEVRSPEAAAARDELISLEVEDADLRLLVELLHGDLPATVVVDPGIRERISIRLDDVHWNDALEKIARKAHCVLVEERGQEVFRFIQPPSGAIEFRDADLRVALELLGRYTGSDVVVSSEVGGTTSFTLRRPTTEAASMLEKLLAEHGLAIVRDATESGEIARIVRAP